MRPSSLLCLTPSPIYISRDIPEPTARLAANIIAGAGLLDTVDISRAQVSLQSGGNDMAQLKLPGCGVVTLR